MQTDFKDTIEYETVNKETAAAIEEVKLLKADPYKKAYSSFAEIIKEIDKEKIADD